jgi:hypothetical protein
MEDVMEQFATQIEDTRTLEEQLVLEWRITQLERLGVSSLRATTFADLVDWHEIAALVARGCSPELAVEIVR